MARIYTTIPIKDRFWQKVDKTNTCWLWTANKNNQGYGLIYSHEHRRKVLASRVSYELAHETIPEGMYVCHTCDTPACVRPDHLFLGTPLSNMADMISKERVARGSKQPTSKLVESDVLAIRAMLSEKQLTNRSIARMFNVHETTISEIKHRRKWKWL